MVRFAWSESGGQAGRDPYWRPRIAHIVRERMEVPTRTLCGQYVMADWRIQSGHAASDLCERCRKIRARKELTPPADRGGG